MVEWAFILTPLLVLPILFLFRFVGCAEIAGIRDPDPVAGPPPVPKVPNYRDYIMGKPDNPGSVLNPSVKPNPADVIGYWRLVDAASGTVAKDEKGFQDGAYRTSTDPDTIPGGLRYRAAQPHRFRPWGDGTVLQRRLCIGSREE